MNKIDPDAEKALRLLLDKYHIRAPQELYLYPEISPSGLNLSPGWAWTGTPLKENQIPLLTWRLKRKFIELKKIVQEATVEHPRMFRFSSAGNKEHWSWSGLLYRELDLCEFIGNGTITSLQAVITDGEAGNVILRLNNNILCSIEISTRLPSGKALVDRHEIIAQRGVASDMVVDTMIPQHSIYTYTKSGVHHYRDVDEELFGFDEEQVDLIRAAFLVVKQKDVTDEWKARHDHLSSLVESVFRSDKNREKIIFTEPEII